MFDAFSAQNRFTLLLKMLHANYVELDYDSDSVDALSQDREGLWKRVNEAGFLSDDEKRAAGLCTEKIYTKKEYSMGECAYAGFRHEALRFLLVLKTATLEAWHHAGRLRLENDAKHHYNPAQPRVPAGNPDGGQWVDDGAFGLEFRPEDGPL